MYSLMLMMHEKLTIETTQNIQVFKLVESKFPRIPSPGTVPHR